MAALAGKGGGEMSDNIWKDSTKHKPDIGSAVYVKTLSGQVFYAIYTNEDEFDTHRPTPAIDSRESWYKYSSRTVLKWRYFAK